MECKNCGNQVLENEKFCRQCGTLVNDDNKKENNNDDKELESKKDNKEENQNNDKELENQNAIYNNNIQPNMPNQFNQSMPNQFNMQANNMMSPNFEQPQKNNKTFILLIIGIAFIIITLVIVMIFSNLKNNDIYQYNNNIANNSTYKVNVSGYSFNIPSDLIYETGVDKIGISNSTGSWGFVIEVINGNFDQLKSKKDQIQQLIGNYGYSATVPQIQNIDGLEFITLEVNESSQKYIVALTKAEPSNTFAISCVNQDNSIDYSILNKAASIIKSATKTTSYNGLKTDNSLNIGEIAKNIK